MRRIGPEERTDFARYLYRFVNTQALQSLEIENSIIEFSLCTFFPMETLPLPEHLSVHKRSTISSRRVARNTEPFNLVGTQISVSSIGASETTSLEKTQSLASNHAIRFLISQYIDQKTMMSFGIRC